MAIFAPLILPIERRFQTAAVLLWVSALGATVSIFFYFCTFKYLWPLIIIYLIWTSMFDKAPEHGGRRSEWCRQWIGWKYFGQYFPMQLHKVIHTCMVYLFCATMDCLVANLILFFFFVNGNSLSNRNKIWILQGTTSLDTTLTASSPWVRLQLLELRA